jgi:hypothetical protein
MVLAYFNPRVLEAVWMAGEPYCEAATRSLVAVVIGLAE